MAYKPRGRRKYIAGQCKLFWVVEGTVREEIFKDHPVPYPYAARYADTLERTTHKLGRVDVVSLNTKATEYSQLDLFNK